MSSENDRRRHTRYDLRLPIKLHRGNEVLDANILNASQSGCLLQCAKPLEPGGHIETSIPELSLPMTRLHVVRCQSTPAGYTIAAYFESASADEAAIARLADEQRAELAHLRWLN